MSDNGPVTSGAESPVWNCASPPPLGGYGTKRELQNKNAPNATPTRLPVLTPPRTRDTRLDNSLSGRRKTRHLWHSSDSFHPVRSPLLTRHRRHASTAIANSYPVRDTPNNPFIEGGPADSGVTGPSFRPSPRKESKQTGHTTYLLCVLADSRGQRIAYPDHSTNALLHQAVGDDAPVQIEIPKPRLLFPPGSTGASSTNTHTHRRAGLFSDEIENRSSRGPHASIVPEDPDSAWLVGATSEAPNTDPVSTGTIRHDFTPHAKHSSTTPFVFPRRSPRLAGGGADALAMLERAGWSSDDDDSVF